MTAFEQLVSGTIGGDYFPRETETTDELGNTNKQIQDISTSSHSVNEHNKRERSSDEMTDEVESPLVKMANTSHGFVRFRGNETVFKASPVKKAAINVGSATDVPVSTGNVFPYFQGIIQPDAVSMNSMILRRFYQLLGKTHEQCQSRYITIRHGVNSLSTTSRGMEMCHMLLGIELALSTQSRCFLIIEKNSYLGFALLGAKYAIFSNTKWFAPASEKELSEALRSMDPHEAAVSSMTSKLEDLLKKDQYTGSTDKSIFSEPKDLVACLSKLKLDDIDDDDVRELDRCVRSLNYMGTGYLTKNPQMITEMLETLASNTHLAIERPTYLPSVRAPFASKSFILLSRFGPDAPSFWNDRGKEIMCKPVDKSVVTTGGKRKIGDSDIFGNMPNRVLVTPKPLLVAVKDMEKVIDKGRVKMDLDERSGRFRNVSVEHEETKKKMWKALVEVCRDSGKKVKPAEEDGRETAENYDDVMAGLLGTL